MLWIMLAYVDILSPVSLAECTIMLMSLFGFGFPSELFSTVHIPTIYPVSTFLRSCDCLRSQIVIYHVLHIPCTLFYFDSELQSVDGS